MAVPLQRPVSTPLDPDLERQIRELGKTIAALQRKRDELQSRSSESLAAKAGSKFQQLLHAVASEPVEDGMNHPAEPLLRAFWQEHPGYLPGSEALGGNVRPSIFADFLRLAGRVRPTEVDVRDRLLEKGLASPSVEVRDAAVQAAGLWADSSAADALARHHELVPWLADYIEVVKTEIGRGPDAGS